MSDALNNLFCWPHFKYGPCAFRQDAHISLPEDVTATVYHKKGLRLITRLTDKINVEVINYCVCQAISLHTGSKVERRASQAVEMESEADRDAYKRQLQRHVWASKVRGTCLAWCS